MASINEILEHAEKAAILSYGNSLTERTGWPVFHDEANYSFHCTPREFIRFGERRYICCQLDDKEEEPGWLILPIDKEEKKYLDCCCVVSHQGGQTTVEIDDGGMGWQLAALEVGGTVVSAKDIFENK